MTQNRLKIRTQINTVFDNGHQTRLCLNRYNSRLLSYVTISGDEIKQKTIICCRTKAIAESWATRLRSKNVLSRIEDTQLLEQWNITTGKGKNATRWLLVIQGLSANDFEWLLAQDLNASPPRNQFSFSICKPLPHHAHLNRPALVLPVGSWTRIVSSAGGDTGKIGLVESASGGGAIVELAGKEKKFFLWNELQQVKAELVGVMAS